MTINPDEVYEKLSDAEFTVKYGIRKIEKELTNANNKILIIKNGIDLTTLGLDLQSKNW